VIEAAKAGAHIATMPFKWLLSFACPATLPSTNASMLEPLNLSPRLCQDFGAMEMWPEVRAFVVPLTLLLRTQFPFSRRLIS
jgi:hypothetical protein